VFALAAGFLALGFETATGSWEGNNRGRLFPVVALVSRAMVSVHNCQLYSTEIIKTATEISTRCAGILT